MATNFTPDEIESVVSQLVSSTIRRPYDTLGVRRTDITFSDIQQAAAGVFLLYQRTPYYFAFLGTQALEQQLTDLDTGISDLVDLIDVLKRRVTPVTDVSALANAQAALQDLNSSVSANGAPQDVTKVPAYQRFNSNVSRFLNQVGGNIKSGGNIVPTPSDARGQIPTAVADLQAAMTSLVATVGLLANAIKDYASINLATLVSSSVISNAQQMLAARATSLAAMTETQRLDVLRQTVLECLGVQSVVTQFGSFNPPVGIANITGTGLPFSDKARPANGAVLLSDRVGPYALVPLDNASDSTNVLSLWADGATSFPSPPTTQFFLPPSVSATIQGTRSGPFNILAGQNDAMSVLVNGVEFDFNLTSGSSRTAAQVVADITTGLTGTNFKGEAYFSPLMFDGEALASGNSFTMAFGTFPPNNLNPGDEVDIYFGPDATSTRTVVSVTPSPSNPQVITVDGAALTGPTDRIRYGSANRMVRIVPIDRELSVNNKETLQVQTPTAVEQSTGTTIGMYGALLGRSTPTDAAIVATFITANSTRFQANTYFAPLYDAISLRTDPTDAFTLVAYFVRDTATWGAGTTDVILTLATVPDVGLVGGVVCLREGMNINAVGTITAQDDTNPALLTVTFTTTVVASSGLVEVGPPDITSGMVVNIAVGPNNGKYFVDTVNATVPFQFKCRLTIPVTKDGFNQPTFMTGDVGAEGVAFASKSTDLTTEVEIYDPLEVFMNAAGPANAVGTTPYFKLPTKPSDLETGDFIEFFVTSLDEENFDLNIITLFDDTVVQLDGVVDTTSSWPFNVSSLPMAELNTQRIVSFDVYSAQLLNWLKLSDANVRQYFIDLNGLINPLIANQNPTASDVGAAESKLRELQSILTITGAQRVNADISKTLETILDGYVYPFVPEADVLIKSFQEKGADRAVDTLLNCQFAEFFGMDQDDVSYAGSMQKAVRQVATNDLPVRKTDRNTAVQSQLVGTTESIDFETSTEDLDPTPNIDPPGNPLTT